MRRRLALVLAVGGAVALSGCSIAAGWRGAFGPPPPTPVDSSQWTAPPRGYLPAGAAPDAMKVVPPPPADDSPEHLAELAWFRQTRGLEGSPRWTQAIRDADLSGTEGFRGFSCAAGVKIGPKTTPVLAGMLLRLIDDARAVYNPAKDTYARKRPAAGNTEPICVPREPWIETNGSYPSGHSMIGYSWSLILTELVPERATALATRGREFGDSRVICGVHWTSDVAAGRVLAGALVARLHAEPAFQTDLATAKAEVEAARKLGPPEGCPAS